MPALIEIDNLSFSHPVPVNGGQRGQEPLVLKGVDLQIDRGQFVALVGANGSGKTTLARHFNGLLLPTSGRVRIDGLDTRDARNLPAIRSRVGMVFQHPEDQMVATTVEEDVAFGPENLGIERNEIRKRIDDALQVSGIAHLRLRAPYTLSAGQMQRVALAGALAMRPDCIVFDEATAMLDPSGRISLLERIQSLHAAGKTIVMITHFMEEAALAERMIVIRQGSILADGLPRAIFQRHDLLKDAGLEPPPAAQAAMALRTHFKTIPADVMTENELIMSLPANPQSRAYEKTSDLQPTDTGETAIEVRNLWHTYAPGTPFENVALKEVSFSVNEDIIHGLAGSTGSGKSTLLQHLNGLLLPQRGQVRVHQYHLHDKDVDLKAVRTSAGLVFQVPENQMFEPYVGDEIAYGPRRAGLTGDDLRERVRQAMETVGLDFEEYKDRMTFALSGGEKRKVVLASVLALNPEILLLDEPTAGLDPTSRAEMLAFFANYRANGKTIIISSHRMDDLAILASDLTILKEGQVAFSGPVAEAFSQFNLLQAAGLRPPLGARLGKKLRELGWPVPLEILRFAELVEWVGRYRSTSEPV